MIAVPAETLKERIRNDLAAARLALEVLAAPQIDPATRATYARMGRHRLNNARESIGRLAASQESALGRRLAS